MFAQYKVGIILSRHFPFSITKLTFISLVYGQGLSGSGLSHFTDNYVYPFEIVKSILKQVFLAINYLHSFNYKGLRKQEIYLPFLRQSTLFRVIFYRN